MRTNIFILLLPLFFMPVCLHAQTDTTARTDTAIAYQQADTSILFANDTLHNPTKEIGTEIPYLSVYNAADVAVDIRLSANKKAWSDFTLKPKGIRLFRCDGVQTMFVIVDPTNKYPYKAVIYRNEKYIVTYNDGLHSFQIVPIN